MFRSRSGSPNSFVSGLLGEIRRSRFPEPALKITACKCPPFEARVQFSTRDRLRWNEEHTPLAEATKTRHEERARTLTYTKSHTLPISG